MVSDADGTEFPTHAIYDEVRAPERLVWTDPATGMRVTSEFVELADGRTEVQIHQVNVPGGDHVRPRPRPGSSRHSTVSRPTWPRSTRRTRPGDRPSRRTGRPIPTWPGAIAEEYLALAELLASSPVEVWDAPSLCEGWRTREVVAHVTMPARYSAAEPSWLSCRRRAVTSPACPMSWRPATGRSPSPGCSTTCAPDVLHAWQPPGGGVEGALTHCVIHGLDVIEAVPLERKVPEARVRAVLDLLSVSDGPNPFGVELSGVRLEADDMEWSLGAGDVVSGAGSGTRRWC